MLQRPNFCCSCGEKIDRIEWHMWTSRRFCELCQTEHQLDEWLPRIIGGFFLFLGLFGIGSWLGPRQDPGDLVHAPARLAAERADSLAPSRERTPVSLPERGRENIPAEARKATAEPQRPGSSPKKPAAAEPVFLCGAETKKGTACTRRVKGGGRCWQHAGREAMLPEDELAVPAGK